MWVTHTPTAEPQVGHKHVDHLGLHCSGPTYRLQPLLQGILGALPTPPHCCFYWAPWQPPSFKEDWVLDGGLLFYINILDNCKDSWAWPTQWSMFPIPCPHLDFHPNSHGQSLDLVIYSELLYFLKTLTTISHLPKLSFRYFLYTYFSNFTSLTSIFSFYVFADSSLHLLPFPG